MAVCGSKFDPSLLPSSPDIPFRPDPELARAAINAVRRARVISYIERGILPKKAFRSPDDYFDDRDEHCIHLILHRSNCLLGTIRCQFHRRVSSQTDPLPLYRETIIRNGLPSEIGDSIRNQLDGILPGYPVHAEISAWLANPDLRQRSVVGLSSLLCVWSLGNLFPAMPNVSVLRASNAAATTLEQFGGIRLMHENKELIIEDCFYKGPIQWMATHSRQYQERITPIVQDMAGLLQQGGLITFRNHKSR